MPPWSPPTQFVLVLILTAHAYWAGVGQAPNGEVASGRLIPVLALLIALLINGRVQDECTKEAN